MDEGVCGWEVWGIMKKLFSAAQKWEKNTGNPSRTTERKIEYNKVEIMAKKMRQLQSKKY